MIKQLDYIVLMQSGIDDDGCWPVGPVLGKLRNNSNLHEIKWLKWSDFLSISLWSSIWDYSLIWIMNVNWCLVWLQEHKQLQIKFIINLATQLASLPRTWTQSQSSGYQLIITIFWVNIDDLEVRIMGFTAYNPCLPELIVSQKTWDLPQKKKLRFVFKIGEDTKPVGKSNIIPVNTFFFFFFFKTTLS